MTKTLKINNIIYAHYEIEGDVLFLKMRKQIVPEDDMESEEALATIIGNLENRHFTKLAYLNIP